MRGRWLWAVVVTLVTAVALVGLNITYTSYVQQQSDRKWCALLASLDQPDVPATTERGRQVQQQIHELRRGLGCGATP